MNPNTAIYAVAALNLLAGQIRARKISKAQAAADLEGVQKMIADDREPSKDEFAELFERTLERTAELEALVAAKRERL